MDQDTVKEMYEEVEFNLDDFTLRGLRWHKGARHKVVALHGWLDNCASFSVLLPRMTNCDVVAIDLAGHGRSDFRNENSPYNIVRDVRDVLEITKILGWDTFSVIGHSRGAMIANLLAGSFPQRVKRACLIDTAVPATCHESELPRHLAESIDAIMLLKTRKSSMFKTYNAAVRARTKGRFPVSLSAAKLMAERSVQDSESGFYWRYDPWLLVLPEFRFSNEQAKAFVDGFASQALVILATEGILPVGDCPEWYAHHKNLRVQYVAGDHHLHMSDDCNTIDKLSDEIRAHIDA